MRASFVALAASVLSISAVAQGRLVEFGASENFCRLFPARTKTFVKASSDPHDLISAPSIGNDDGFTGTNGVDAFRVDTSLGRAAVLADIEGRPGYMGCFFRNFWSDWSARPLYFPEEFNRTQLVVDGVVAHDHALPDFFRNVGEPGGQIPPFTGPFTGRRSGGHLTHTPIVWEDQFRLQVFENAAQNEARFFKIAGVLGAPDAELPVPSLDEWNAVAWNRGAWPHRNSGILRTDQLTIPAQSSVSLDWSGPGTLLGLNMIAGQNSDWLDLFARFEFDGGRVPSDEFPLRLLGGMMRPPFQYGLQGLLFNNDGDRRVTSYFPMPFEESARLVIRSRSGQPIQLTVDSRVAPALPEPPWGYFAPQYFRQATTRNLPFDGPKLENCHGILRQTLLESAMDTTQEMRFVTAQHLEGDLCVRINGNRGDEHNFAASETSIGKFGWYSGPRDVPFNEDESFNTQILFRRIGRHIYTDRIMGSTFVFDPIHFVDGIDMKLEHGPYNQFNADYAFFNIFYLRPGAAREVFDVVDVGDLASEAAHNASFTERRNYSLTANFFRDEFYGTEAVTDDVRELLGFYRFDVEFDAEQAYSAIGVGFRLDRDRTASTKFAQADVYVDGFYAGLLHAWNSNEWFRWKEGGELEVEIPAALTRGKSRFTVEIRPRAGTDPVNLARIEVFGYH